MDMTAPTVRLRLDEILAERGMTQTELAKVSGISRQAINNLANNPNAIKLETLQALSKALGIPISEILVQE
jgi:DNA-binding Xre family transcriptional regulator